MRYVQIKVVTVKFSPVYERYEYFSATNYEILDVRARFLPSCCTTRESILRQGTSV